MEPSELCEIPIEIFKNITGRLFSDVFIRLGPRKFTQIFKGNDLADKQRFDSYMAKGAKSLFIRKTDRKLFADATERYIRALFEQKTVTHEDANRIIWQISEQTFQEILDDGFFKTSQIMKAMEDVRSVLGLIQKVEPLLADFVLGSRQEIFYLKHCIQTAVYSCLLARQIEIPEEELSELALGALLHDLGVFKLSNKAQDLDFIYRQEEFDEFSQHPKLGANLVHPEYKLPQGVCDIIEQHHEHFDGSGYPSGLTSENISALSQIVSLADVFSALTARRHGRATCSMTHAIGYMESEIHKFNPELFETLKANLLTAA